VSSLDIDVFAYFLSRDYAEFLECQEVLLFQIMETIQSAGTSLALPSQRMYLDEAATPGTMNQERAPAVAAIRAAARTESPPAPLA
jgi:MscS family membrane protein